MPYQRQSSFAFAYRAARSKDAWPGPGRTVDIYGLCRSLRRHRTETTIAQILLRQTTSPADPPFGRRIRRAVDEGLALTLLPWIPLPDFPSSPATADQT